MPTALILGTGMVGSALERLAPEHGWQAIALNHRDVEVTDPESVISAVREARPDVVFHAAALTRVNYCEEHPAEAMAVNATGTANVAAAAANAGARLVYFSTDYVFDGTKGSPYTEDDDPNPVNEYGWSKLAGEAHVLAHARGQVVRTSGVFGPRADRFERNFIRAIHHALKNGSGPIDVVDDQFTALTYAPHLAAMCYAMLEQDWPQIVHITSSGEGSWYDWATTVEQAGYTGPSRIKPVPLKSRDTGTPRPIYSVLQSKCAAVRQLASRFEAVPAIREYVGLLK